MAKCFEERDDDEPKHVQNFPPAMVKSANLMRWCSTVVEEESEPSFPAVIAKSEASCDWAEASVHCKEAKKGFE